MAWTVPISRPPKGLVATGIGVGMTVVVASAVAREPSLAVAGACLIFLLLTAYSLARIRGWMVDISGQRAHHLRAAAECEAARARYFAAQSAVEAERSRLIRDREDVVRHAAEQLELDRAALRQAFEDERSALKREAFRQAVEMVQDGLLDDEEEGSQAGVVLRLPDRGGRPGDPTSCGLKRP